MDFHTLSRKELQTLCKKNNIPANVTNIAMANALSALHQVEGLDELVNAQQFQEDKVIETPGPGTHCRTSTRRKAVTHNEGIEQEKIHVNVAMTPAVSTTRRRTAAVSTRRKTTSELLDNDKSEVQVQRMPTEVPITPAAPTTATRVYNTRRSVRLLEKNLSKMSLMDTEDVVGGLKIDDMSEDMSNTNISQQTEDLAETEKRSSMEMVSTVVSEKTGELEVTFQEKITEYERGFKNENAAGNSLQAEQQEGFGEAKPLEAEPSDSNLKMEDSSETYNYSSEVCDGSGFEMNKPTGEAVPAEKQADTGYSEPFESPEDALGEVAASSLCVEVPNDASMEVTGQDIVDSLSMSFASKTDNHDDHDSAEISDLSDEVFGDASMEEVTHQDVAALTAENFEIPDNVSLEATGQDIVGSFLISSASDGSEDASMGESRYPAQSEPKDVKDEAIQKGEKNKTNVMKENTSCYEYQKMSIRELKKMLKNMKLDGKSNRKCNGTKEGDGDETALQALPENLMIADETQNDD
ncbi:hypothetical protein RJT34_05208 [Clitoria ternatea]|uniref:Uncharacterized protein n=1 Tax=Clitoria ternatea TaxID=43366 RepID=A0AAN9K0D7_CLITE